MHCKVHSNSSLNQTKLKHVTKHIFSPPQKKTATLNEHQLQICKRPMQCNMLNVGIKPLAERII